ncbi:ATP-binding protein, partial [Marinovum sp. 1_MG-2023]
LGMNEDQIKHIFEPFYTTKRNQGGSGLGAHLIYNLVTTTLQGRITLESEVNKGVTYTIYLPLTVKYEKPKPN